MAIESTGRSKHERPRTSARPQRVIRLHALPAYLGVTRSAIQHMIDAGLLHPFSVTGKRAMVVTEDEIMMLQERAKAKALASAKADAIPDDDATEADEPRPRQRLKSDRAPAERGSRTRSRAKGKPSDEVQNDED
jgi:hypothetical protein